MKKLFAFALLLTACLIALHLFARGDLCFAADGGTATLSLTWPF